MPKGMSSPTLNSFYMKIIQTLIIYVVINITTNSLAWGGRKDSSSSENIMENVKIDNITDVQIQVVIEGI